MLPSPAPLAVVRLPLHRFATLTAASLLLVLPLLLPRAIAMPRGLAAWGTSPPLRTSFEGLSWTRLL